MILGHMSSLKRHASYKPVSIAKAEDCFFVSHLHSFIEVYSILVFNPLSPVTFPTQCIANIRSCSWFFIHFSFIQPCWFSPVQCLRMHRVFLEFLSNFVLSMRYVFSFQICLYLITHMPWTTHPLFNTHPCTLEHPLWKVPGALLACPSLAHGAWEKRKLHYGKKQVKRHKRVA